ncbi:MAG: bestrophin family ion channel, partial [Planctomycetota bacterium]
MIVNKKIPLRRLLLWTGPSILVLAVWSAVAVCIHQFGGLSWMTIPWLPLSLIGTAVAFYLGFKNNSAYDRMWEARKVWGGIVNSSRAWGIGVKAYVTDLFSDAAVSEDELHSIRQRLIYRQIAWMYALRSQLLVSKEWEHSEQGGYVGRTASKYQKQFGTGLIDDEITKNELHQFLAVEEFERLIQSQNTATQIIDAQANDLKELRQRDLVDDFRHIELQELLQELYVHQGKCERIKNFPLPRQYANTGSIFVYLFLTLLPFGMVSEFAKLGEHGAWLSIPFTALVGWVFSVMESVGDYSGRLLRKPISGDGERHSYVLVVP